MDARCLILEARLGPRRGRKVALRPGEALIVGRSPEGGLSIPEDTKLAARHFELSWDGKTGRFKDLREGGEETLLNGERREEAEVRHGAWIRAGGSDFMVTVEAHTPPSPPDDAPEEDDDDEGEESPPPFAAEPPPPPSEPQPTEEERRWMEAERKRSRQSHAVERRMARRARILREQAAERALPILQAAAEGGALHAILDAARTPRILQVLREAVEEHRSLYEGTQGVALEDVAPYLVPLAPGSRLLAQLVREGWGLRWGIFLEGAVRERELRRHLRRYLKVENDRGEPLYFRYYDPGALRPLWPACTRRQLADLLGPLQAYLVEGEKGEVLRLTAAGKVEPLDALATSG